jgi:hypothetical protein
MKLTKYQLIKIKVNATGESVKFTADTDKQYERIDGMFLSLPKDDSHFGSALELRIADQEILPEGFETKMLACNQSTSPNERFFIFDADEQIEAHGSHIEGRFTDGGFTTGITFPYQAIIYLKLKNGKPDDEPQK